MSKRFEGQVASHRRVRHWGGEHWLGYGDASCRRRCFGRMCRRVHDGRRATYRGDTLGRRRGHPCRADATNEADAQSVAALAVGRYGGRLLTLQLSSAEVEVDGRKDGMVAQDLPLEIFDLVWRYRSGRLLSVSPRVYPVHDRSGGGLSVHELCRAGSMGMPVEAPIVRSGGRSQLDRTYSCRHGKRGPGANAVAPGATLTKCDFGRGDAWYESVSHTTFTTRLGRPSDPG